MWTLLGSPLSEFNYLVWRVIKLHLSWFYPLVSWKGWVMNSVLVLMLLTTKEPGYQRQKMLDPDGIPVWFISSTASSGNVVLSREREASITWARLIGESHRLERLFKENSFVQTTPQDSYHLGSPGVTNHWTAIIHCLATVWWIKAYWLDLEPLRKDFLKHILTWVRVLGQPENTGKIWTSLTLIHLSL